MLTGENIFITGGAGYLGRHLIERYYNNNSITVYSRDEAKHYYLKQRWPKVNFVIGDIRNEDLIIRASRNHSIGIFAASLKQIEAVDENVAEGVNTIVLGALNSRRCVEDNEMKAGCFISTDKSRAATTLYGSMKFVGGESFIVNAFARPRLSTAIYGNVINSTGSVIPLIWNAINNEYPLSLYSSEMTRFMLTIDEAIATIERGLALSGYNIIPAARSFRIRDLFDLYHEKHGLVYYIGVPRISEKIHEVMISRDEAPRTLKVDNFYHMHYRNISPSPPTEFPDGEYSSANALMNIEELREHLEANNYYEPGRSI
jgi:UDP-glucose 4-epimerase